MSKYPNKFLVEDYTGRVRLFDLANTFVRKDEKKLKLMGRAGGAGGRAGDSELVAGVRIVCGNRGVFEECKG